MIHVMQSLDLDTGTGTERTMCMMEVVRFSFGKGVVDTTYVDLQVDESGL